MSMYHRHCYQRSLADWISELFWYGDFMLSRALHQLDGQGFWLQLT